MTNFQAIGLLTAAKKVRQLQRDYYRCRQVEEPTRKQQLLNESKAAESSLDRLIAAIEAPAGLDFGD